jgi:hypothetical protein
MLGTIGNLMGTHCGQQKYQKLRLPSPLFFKDKMMISLGEPAPTLVLPQDETA